MINMEEIINQIKNTHEIANQNPEVQAFNLKESNTSITIGKSEIRIDYSSVMTCRSIISKIMDELDWKITDKIKFKFSTQCLESYRLDKGGVIALTDYDNDTKSTGKPVYTVINMTSQRDGDQQLFDKFSNAVIDYAKTQPGK